MEKLLQSHLMGEKLAVKDYIDLIILLMKKYFRGVSAPAPGLYTCI